MPRLTRSISNEFTYPNYTPVPAPYRLALDTLDIAPANAVFVAGSAYDLFGTQQVGLPTTWHNRVRLAAPEGAPPARLIRPTLETLVADVACMES